MNTMTRGDQNKTSKFAIATHLLHLVVEVIASIGTFRNAVSEMIGWSSLNARQVSVNVKTNVPIKHYKEESMPLSNHSW